MRLRKELITVADLQVEVWWKAVKRINLVVYAEEGRVRISVPFATSKWKVEETILSRMVWIKAQQAKFSERKPLTPLSYTDGELHPFWGEKYPLQIKESGRCHFVHFDPHIGITLHIRRKSSVQQRHKLLLKWYREQLFLRILLLQKQWQARIGVTISEFRIKRMKTRWGTCNIRVRRIWLNLELIKKPEQCLEYILVHEMVHLLEPGHTKKFYTHLDVLLPAWRSIDELLKKDT